MTYEQTLDYLFAKLPMYQRIGKQAFKKDLTNIIKLCNALDNPQCEFKSIHIAGTNGKGSTSHILSSIYQHNGYKVGLYTSPHLVDFRERIKINGAMCSKEFVVEFTKAIEHLIDDIQPSFFEITVAMAFQYFAKEKVDVAIIETGLGGRLDSTNIIDPIAAIITSIGFDHMDMLGNTLTAIATEKAGIIKQHVPVIIGNIDDEPKQVIASKAVQLLAPIYSTQLHQFNTDLLGDYQQWNISCAMKCVEVIQDILPTNKTKNDEALLKVGELSNFTGRWQIVHKDPLVICDVGHNEQGFQLIAKELVKYNLNIYYILGFVQEKDLSSIIPILPKGQEYHFVKPEVIRGMHTKDVQKAFHKFNIEGTSHPNLKLAVNEVFAKISQADKKNNSILFIGGSNFVVADLLHLTAKDSNPF